MTPLLEKAIRAGCDPEYDGGIPCQYPQCHCQLSKRIELAFAAALADDEATVEAMKTAIWTCDEASAWDSIAEDDCWKAAKAVLATLRRHILGEGC